MKQSIKVLQTILSIVMLFTISLTLMGCYHEPDPEPDYSWHPEPNPEPEPTVTNYAPYSLRGKYITLSDRDKLQICANLTGQNDCTLENFTNDEIYTQNNAPKYKYEKSSEANKATFTLEYYEKFYAIEYNGYIPSFYRWTIDLIFTSSTGGTYSGKLENEFIKDHVRLVSGNFTLTNEFDAGIKITKPEISEITYKSAKVKAAITCTNGCNGRNICYGTSPNPDKSSTVIHCYENNIEEELKSLEANTTYYVRICADYKDKTFYSEQVSFTTDAIENVNVNISKPEIRDINNYSANVVGTILCNYDFSERGVCYSTSENPTNKDNVVKVTGNVVNVNLYGLKEGTEYYVRLYGICNGKIYYGEQEKFSTKGIAAQKIEIKQNIWGPNAVRVSVKIPNDVNKYGLCWGTKPKPKISDKYSEETTLTSKKSWDIDNLQPATKYYVRAYHKDGSNIIYYENSEIEIQTIGDKDGFPNITRKSRYNTTNMTNIVNYKNLPSGTYVVKTYDSRYYASDDVSLYYLYYSGSSYAEGPNGENTSELNYHTSGVGYYGYVSFISVETGDVYYVILDVNNKILSNKSHLVPWYKKMLELE